MPRVFRHAPKVIYRTRAGFSSYLVPVFREKHTYRSLVISTSIVLVSSFVIVNIYINYCVLLSDLREWKLEIPSRQLFGERPKPQKW